MQMLSEIVTAIDERIAGTPLGDFYAQRKAASGGYAWKGPLLQVLHDGGAPRRGYAFHKGGRGELQFNVGFEQDGAVFRYGVAFSLRADRNLPEPIAQLESRLACFNRVVSDFTFSGEIRLSLQDTRADAVLPPGPVPAQWIQEGAFIFLGERVRVAANGLTGKQISRASEVLQELLPLYLRIAQEHAQADSLPSRVARLCWNDALWQEPSGRIGKSTSASFEADTGFGHEEWLFDVGTLLDGWKYGFVQALNHSHAKYQGTRLSLLLYAIDDRDKQRYWVGTIDSAEVITESHGTQVITSFKARGWLQAMQAQLEQLGLDASTLDVAHPRELFNLRFRPESLRVFEKPVPFPGTLVPSARYGLLQAMPPGHLAMFRPGDAAEALIEQDINATKASVDAYVVACERDLVQAQWQKELKKTLKQDLPGVTVAVEARVDGHRVDAVLEKNGRRVFIELKARGLVRAVIRDALSQLLEYAYWPEADRCRALLIVGAFEAREEDHAYLAMLRQRFGLPVHYLHYREGRIVGISAWYDGLG